MKLFVVGGDSRIGFMAEKLATAGYDVSAYGTSSTRIMEKPLEEGAKEADAVITGLPISKDCETLFAPFGKILSATVNVDIMTGESKGFGFVSFASPENASQAIYYMNGFRIDNKRLKVEHKKVKG